jgi:ketosteroid isomerase-like protein
MRQTLPLMVAAAALSLAACAATPPASTTDYAAIGKAIDSLDLAAQRWLNDGMVDSLLSGYYSSDAIVMNPGAPVPLATDAIRTSLTEMYKTVSLRLHFQRTDLIASDSVASDHGTYQLEIRDKNDSSKVMVSDHGNYVTTFVKRDGQWRSIYDIATSDVPPPAPAQPAAAKKK